MIRLRLDILSHLTYAYNSYCKSMCSQIMTILKDFDNYCESEEDEGASFDTYDEFSDRELELLRLFGPLGSMSKISGLDEDTLRGALLLTQISPDKSAYTDVEKYIANGDSHSFKLSLERLFKIRRFEENNDCYEKSNRMMLWHGTKQSNLGSILQFGLLLPEQKRKRQMFGCGLYTADRVSKSVQYCQVPIIPGNKAYVLLCDVNLGKIHSVCCAYNNLQKPPSGYDSVKGVGKHIPDKNLSSFYQGSLIPLGKTVDNTQVQTKLNYNEFIVYDANRIIIKFVAEVKFG